MFFDTLSFEQCLYLSFQTSSCLNNHFADEFRDTKRPHNPRPVCMVTLSTTTIEIEVGHMFGRPISSADVFIEWCLFSFPRQVQAQKRPSSKIHFNGKVFLRNQQVRKKFVQPIVFGIKPDRALPKCW
jgi:hypothetical protein